MSKPIVLVVEDEPGIADTIHYALASDGFEPLGCASGAEAIAAFSARCPALAILDVGLPDMNGFELFRRLQELPGGRDVPMVFLTARSSEIDRVVGLELGADDYITKPFDSKEMAARVKAVLRRTMGQTEEEEESNDDTLSFPGLTVSLSRYEVFYEGKKLEMPPKELEVLYFLASHVNQLFTRGQLLDQVWGFQVEVESRTVDVHVKRLRDKLVGCEKYGWRIQTIWGRGYKFEVIK